MNAKEYTREQAGRLAVRLGAGWSYQKNKSGQYLDEDLEHTSPHAFLEDVIDLEFRFGRSDGLRGGKALVLGHGPSLWVEINKAGGSVFAAYADAVTEVPFFDGGALFSALKHAAQGLTTP